MDNCQSSEKNTKNVVQISPFPSEWPHIGFMQYDMKKYEVTLPPTMANIHQNTTSNNTEHDADIITDALNLIVGLLADQAAADILCPKKEG